MEKSYQIINQETINGKDYINIKFDVFHALFLDVVKHKKTYNRDIVERLNKEFMKACRIKRKRMRLKKQKMLLLAMSDMLFD